MAQLIVCLDLQLQNTKILQQTHGNVAPLLIYAITYKPSSFLQFCFHCLTFYFIFETAESHTECQKKDKREKCPSRKSTHHP